MSVISEVTIDTFMNDYEQVRTPDFVAIANHVNYAKGPDRNMAQFAEATGIGASTLSRIVNGRSTKPLSKEAIVKIFEARANPESVALLDLLARANGMFPRDYVERVRSNDRFVSRRNEEINRLHMMKNSLIASIASSGMPIKQVVNSPIYNRMCNHLPLIVPRRRGDFVIELPPQDENNVIYSWTFFLFPYEQEEIDAERHVTPRSRVQHIIERLSGWFLMDAWDMDIVKGDKFSFCFIDADIFQEFVEALQYAKLKTEMTAVLINPTNYTVEKEVWLPGNYEQLTQISVFQVVMPEDDYPDDEENDENMEDFE